MKFIHLTDTDVIGEGLLYGQDPAERLARALASINAEHRDAEFVVVTSEMTHWGDSQAYAQFADEIRVASGWIASWRRPVRFFCS